VHAQFEVIHPYADGNGRVGRALTHLVLRHRGVTTYRHRCTAVHRLPRARRHVSRLPGRL
jgi:fido (protein-threonine AMPylation protein)